MDSSCNPMLTIQDVLSTNELAAGGVNLSNAFAESVLFGIHSMLVIVSVIVLIRTGWRHRPRLFMIIACVVLYSMSVWHWAITVNDMIVLSSLSSGILSAGSNYIDYIATQGSNFTSCSDFQSFDKDVDDGIVGILLETTQSKACAAITPLLISIIVGDMVVLWRALVLWPRNRAVQAIAAGLLLSTLGTSAASLAATCAVQWNGPVSQATRAEFSDRPGAAAFTLSWITNICATSLISYRTWIHRRTLLQTKLQSANQWPTKTSRILLLFIESGVTYCALWTCLAVASLWNASPSAIYSDGMQALYDGVSNLKQSALVNIIGIYPTALILAVALSDSYAERALQNSTSLHPRLPSTSPPRSVPRSTATETSSDDTDAPLSEHDSNGAMPLIVLSASPPLTPGQENKYAEDMPRRESSETCSV